MFHQNRTSRRNAWGCALAITTSLFISTISQPAVAQQFTLICMPDPQFYTNSNHASLYNLYNRQTMWIRDNKTALNIKHVIWLGDLTNDNTSTEWNTATNAYTILDQAQIPYAVVPGNHDYKTNNSDVWVGACLRDLSKYNKAVGPQRFAGKSWYGGNKDNTTDHNENNYTFFSADGLNFLVIGLEYAPRKEAVTWANNLISQYPNYRVIIFTHMYMTSNGNYGSGAGSATGTVGDDGKDLWDECASRHSNVFMVVCGHVTESVTNTKTGLNGNTVYEMLVDYQGEKVKGTGDQLGNGWLRILQFDPTANKIHGSTITAGSGDTAIFTNGIDAFYNGPYGKTPTAPDHLFTLNYDMTSPMPPYTYMNSSTNFHDRCLNDIVTDDQVDPDIAQADNGNWAGVWKEDDNSNGIYHLLVRGFDPDANERFSKRIANTIGVDTINVTHPAIAMAADGRFVVAWQSGSTAIKMRAFNADGSPVLNSGEQTVVSVTTGTVNWPDVAMDNSGKFVVTWADDRDGDGTFDIRARGFYINYLQSFAEKVVSTVSSGQKQEPNIAMAGNGDYVICWQDETSGNPDVAARGYLANETQHFPQILLNSITVGPQQHPAIAMDDTGRFVSVWEDDNDQNGAYQVHARGFAPNGTQLFPSMTVNVNSAGNQLNPSVAMDQYGNWYPVWEDDGAVSSGQGFQIMSNEFNISGTRLNPSDVRANSVTAVSHNFGNPNRMNPVVSAHKSGRYIVAWTDDMDGNGAFQALSRGMSGTARSLAIKAVNGHVTKLPNDAFYAPNTVVTLTAVPDPGHSFVRWSGDVPAGTETATSIAVSMDTSKKVTATFTTLASVADWQLF
jgi:hypothetical protein